MAFFPISCMKERDIRIKKGNIWNKKWKRQYKWKSAISSIENGAQSLKNTKKCMSSIFHIKIANYISFFLNMSMWS